VVHQAVAGNLVTDPDAVLGKAFENLDRLLVQHQGTMTEVWLTRWRESCARGLAAATCRPSAPRRSNLAKPCAGGGGLAAQARLVHRLIPLESAVNFRSSLPSTR
jgi:hypothetical protein